MPQAVFQPSSPDASNRQGFGHQHKQHIPYLQVFQVLTLCVKSARAGNNLKEKKRMVNCNTSPSFTSFLTDGSVGSTALIERPSHSQTLSLSFAQLFSKPVLHHKTSPDLASPKRLPHRQPHVCQKPLPARLPGLSSRLPSEPWRPSEKAGSSHSPGARTPTAPAPTIPPASAGLPSQPKLPADADTSGRAAALSEKRETRRGGEPKEPVAHGSHLPASASGQGRRPRRPALTRSTGRNPAAAGGGAWRRRRS